MTIFTIQHPEHGVLDWHGWKFSSNQTLKFNVEWDFYPYNLSAEGDKTVLQVPHTWDEAFVQDKHRSFRYGTYRLRILLDQNHEQTLRLPIQNIGNASAVYVNGQLVAGAGQPSSAFALKI
ncbi:hypothetical protein ACP8HI_14490 [Paenibacillus sp. FA6]|uniref:hypothetical protein n=1 Tax=Paenibacillus sp. FA6 TaxID=3413029 RepID=UPI003F660A84